MPVLPQWAPRLPPALIRRLYEQDARGIVDAELIDEVAYSLYARCESILTVTRAEHGVVACPACGTEITRHGPKEEMLLCQACGWQATWGGVPQHVPAQAAQWG